jgi:hypothetical protein
LSCLRSATFRVFSCSAFSPPLASSGEDGLWCLARLTWGVLYFVSALFMLTFRLGNLCKRKGSLPVHAIETDRTGLRFYPKQFGDPGHAVELLIKLKGGDWLVSGLFAQEDLQESIMLLQEGLAWANDHADLPRQLQTAWVCGATYFVDERLRELRKKDDPSNRIQLDLN